MITSSIEAKSNEEGLVEAVKFRAVSNLLGGICEVWFRCKTDVWEKDPDPLCSDYTTISTPSMLMPVGATLIS